MVEIPKTCKAALLEEYGKPLQIREVAIPEVEPMGILVKVEMAGICGTDVHSQRGDLTIKTPLPNIPGHETLGRVVKLGAGRTMTLPGNLCAVGDRIMWAHIDCGECYGCEVARDSAVLAQVVLWILPSLRPFGRFCRIRVHNSPHQGRESSRGAHRGRGSRRGLCLQNRSGSLREIRRHPFPGECRDTERARWASTRP